MALVAQQRTARFQKPDVALGKPAKRFQGTSPSGESASEDQTESVSWWSELLETIRVAPFGNACVVLAMIIGFFHGWLKRTYPGALSVFAYDIPLMLGLVAAWFSVRAGKNVFPSSRVATAIKVVIGIVVLYAIVPTDVPWVIRLASVRGWLFMPLIFLVGYHSLSNPNQLKWLGRLILILCVVTTIYGMRQNPEELLSAAVEDQGYLRTLNGVTYTAEGGGRGFRVFSTFVGAGMFATALSFGIILGLAEMMEPGTSMKLRSLIAIMVAFATYGIFISGTRSSIISSMLGALVISWLRGSLVRSIPLIAGLGVSTFVVGNVLQLMDSSRIMSAFSIEKIMWRFLIVLWPTAERLLECPLGQGIGYSTHGIPVILSKFVTGYFSPTGIDGDLGHAAVDFGLFGMVAYCFMIFRAFQDCVFWTRAQRHGVFETVGITTSAFSALTIVSFTIGSPFLHVPTGAIVWLYIGGLNRYFDDLGGSSDSKKWGIVHKGRAVECAPAAPHFIEGNTSQTKPNSMKPPRPPRFLYR